MHNPARGPYVKAIPVGPASKGDLKAHDRLENAYEWTQQSQVSWMM